MDIAQNSKQFEYLMAIRDVGMQIVFKKADMTMLINNFKNFDTYIENPERRLQFLKSLEKVARQIIEGICTPDALLLELGQYTPDIIYDDGESDPDQTQLYNDNDSWLYSQC